MTFYPITIASSSRVQLMRPTSLPTLASCALNPSALPLLAGECVPKGCISTDAGCCVQDC
jgi:hypothetical protein